MNSKAKAGLIIAVIGFLYTVQAYMMPRAAVGNPMAPVIYPLILGVFLTLCSCILFLKEYYKGEKDKELNEEQKKNKKEVNKLIGLTCIAGIVYALLFNRIGYVLSTIIFLGTIMYALNGKSTWKKNTLVAVGFSIVVYYIFSSLLAIPLPRLPFLDI